jgi:hypothetical protein
MRVLAEASGQSRRWYLTSQPKQEGTKPKKAAWGYARRKWCSESGCEVDQGHSKKGLALGLRIDRRDPIRRVAYCGSRILRICVSIAMNSLAFRVSLLPRCFDFQFYTSSRCVHCGTFEMSDASNDNVRYRLLDKFPDSVN